MEALDVIRRMAVRHGDDQIASVLNRLGYVTGKGTDGIRRVSPPRAGTIRLQVRNARCLILRESA